MATKAKTKTKAPAQKTAKKAVAPKAAKKVTKKSIPSTEFKLFAPEASEVYLAGEFNDWNSTELNARRFKDGTWKKMLKLKPGRYEYLFLVDGQWWTDPENPNRSANSFGTENSVIIVS